MNLKQVQYQAERDYDVTARLYKRISTLEFQCTQLESKYTQLEMEFATLYAIVANMNEALAEQKIKPLPSGKNSPVFYQQMA